jgi:cytochrome c oxidase cbb3-type subunit I
MRAAGATVAMAGTAPGRPATVPSREAPVYVEAAIRGFAIATVFWGVVGFLMGVLIASQLAFPLLNLDLEWTTFGRLRPSAATR